MGSGSKCRVRVELGLGTISGVRVRFGYQKKSGFLWDLGDFGFTTTSLLMGSGSKSWVQVQFLGFRSGTKKVGFSGT